LTQLADLPVIIVGAGGHAKVLIEALRILNRKIIGITDSVSPQNMKDLDIEYLGGDDAIYGYAASELELVNGIGALPQQDNRWKVAARMRKRGYKFTSVIHPSAIIPDDILFGEGVQVMAGCVFQPGIVIGDDSIVNTGSIIDHDCRIGKNCHLAPGVILCGGVNIQDSVHIGAGTTVIQNLEIGSGSVIAAGSSIYKSISAGITYIQKRQSNQYTHKE